MKIIIETIPHEQQRYPTVGDWQWQGEDLIIRVSNLSDWRRVLLVAVHEVIEVGMCKNDGVTELSVDEFDMQYEKDREAGLHGPEDEPGDDPKCPCRRQHFVATNIERIFADALGVDWESYADEVSNL